MYHLHVDLADDLADAVKAYATEWGISIAAATRILLRNGVTAPATRSQIARNAARGRWAKEKSP